MNSSAVGRHICRPQPRQPVKRERGRAAALPRPSVRDPFTAVCRGRACPARPTITTFYPSSEGLDRLTAHNEAPSASKAGPLMRLFALQGQTFASRFRSAQPWAHAHNPHLHGASGTPPLQHNPQGFSLPQTSAAAWGQAATSTLPHSVGRAFARNSFTPPVGAGHARPYHYHSFILLHNRPAPQTQK